MPAALTPCVARALRAALPALAALSACHGDTARVCSDGAAQRFFCGVNRRGTQTRTCADGAWSALDACSDPDVCADDATRALACGRNGRGAALETCVKGAWEPPDACADPDVCVDGTAIPLACGFNGRGAQTRSCAMGAWSTSSCADPDACTDGATGSLACGEPGSLGAQTRTCTLGQWSDYGACLAPLVIRAPGRRDMVHDAARHRLYITTHGTSMTDGQVLSYDLAARQFDPPLLTGGAFLGIDLSPDGDQLAIADAATDATHSWIYRIDLTTRAIQKIAFNRGWLEVGTFSVVFSTSTEVLVTSTLDGSSGGAPSRRVDLTSPTTWANAGPFSGMSEATMLSRSAGGSFVGVAMGAQIPGEFGRYDVAGRSLATAELLSPVYDLAIERSAAQLAVPTYDGLVVVDREFKPLATLGTHARALPVGAAYSPVRDELYLAWSGAATSIDVYSTTTLRKLRDIAPLPGLFFWDSSGSAAAANHAYSNGRLRISRDGTLIFATAPPVTVLVYPTGL